MSQIAHLIATLMDRIEGRSNDAKPQSSGGSAEALEFDNTVAETSSAFEATPARAVEPFAPIGHAVALHAEHAALSPPEFEGAARLKAVRPSETDAG